MSYTKLVKEKIVDNAVSASTIPANTVAAKEEMNQLHIEIYHELLGGKKEADKILRKVEAVKSAFADSDALRGSLSVSYCREGVNVAGVKVYIEPRTDGVIYPDIRAGLSLNSEPMKQRYITICEKMDKLKQSERDLETEVWAVLNSVTTVKKLLTVWPEVEPLLPPEAACSTKSGLPSVQVAELNVLIGLPKEE